MRRQRACSIEAPIPARRVLINYRLAMTCWFVLWRLQVLILQFSLSRRPVLKVEMRATPRCCSCSPPSAIRNCANPHAAAARLPLRREISRSQQSDRALECMPAALPCGLQPVTEPQAGPASRGGRARKKKRAPPHLLVSKWLSGEQGFNRCVRNSA
jgi:hypothetical protein